MSALDYAIRQQQRYIDRAQEQLAELLALEADMPDLSGIPFLCDIAEYSVYRDSDTQQIVVRLNASYQFADASWREQSQVILSVRRAFHIRRFSRELSESSGATTYRGESKRYRVSLYCGKGGLPPTCTLVSEQRTEVTTRTVYKTVCE